MVFGEFEKLVEKGFSQKAFFNLVLKTREDLFYLGGICLSEGDRIIYFPGTTNNTIKDTPARKYIGERLDHLTLEKDL
ncbi:MAG: hypothetical protein NTW06_02230, partial [Candidatus Falkowbacteria bacterium]|nr:hypothetical protein [Candidatus Falkowbacteria bacterium]